MKNPVPNATTCKLLINFSIVQPDSECIIKQEKYSFRRIQNGVWGGAPMVVGGQIPPPHCKTFYQFYSLLRTFKQITVTNQLSLLMYTFASHNTNLNSLDMSSFTTILSCLPSGTRHDEKTDHYVKFESSSASNLAKTIHRDTHCTAHSKQLPRHGQSRLENMFPRLNKMNAYISICNCTGVQKKNFPYSEAYNSAIY